MGLKAFWGPSTFQINPFFNLSTTGGAGDVEANETTTGLAALFQPRAPWKGRLAFSMDWRDAPGIRNQSLQIGGRIGWSAAATKAAEKIGIEFSIDGGYRAIISGNDEENPGSKECSVLLSLKIPLFS